MKRSTSSILTIIALLLILVLRPGCPLSVDELRDIVRNDTGNEIEVVNDHQPVTTSTSPGTVIIGSFNIESFGTAKAARPQVMATLADIARRFDLLAIQELRNKDQSVIRQFTRLCLKRQF